MTKTTDDIIPFPEKKPNSSASDSDQCTSSVSSSVSSRAPTRSSSLASVMSAYEKPQQSEKDAGNKPLDHYKTKLPPWRYKARQYLLPMIRWETPHLAKLQSSLRCLPLDVFFALSANLGTHTFYAIMLPVCFWFGQFHFGFDLVFVLAFGVYLTGFLKDLLCLPRPLSPPLHRITMSGSAALEYGFPSTHTANAVAVGLLFLTKINENYHYVSPNIYILQHIANALYVFAIVAGRIYCGMHGFLDVLVGGLLGFGLWLFRYEFGTQMDYFLASNNYADIAYVALLIGLVRFHPEPADDCPCFDDGVSFLGVELGIHGSNAYFGYISSHKSTSCYGCLPYFYDKSGLLGSVARLLIGITMVMIWRSVSKPFLHKHLPPLFRLFERVGLSMPRKFFTPASQYTKVPKSLPDSTFNSDELSSIFKGRSDSVGPQSEADVYESLAYREYQRKKASDHEEGTEYEVNYRGRDGKCVKEDIQSSSTEGDACYSNDFNQEQLMSTVVVPRVRYDVEVVTRLIVYAGISVVSLALCPVIFEVLVI